MTITLIAIGFILIVYFFSRKKDNVTFNGTNGTMFDFSKIPNSGFNKRSKKDARIKL